MSTETTTQSTTKFVKIEREQFDNVLRVGTPEFLARVKTMTQDELQRGERWINELRAQKGKDTYLTFPVRKEKQQAAGVLYLKAMSAFRTAVRTELAARTAMALFSEAPAAIQAVVAA
jgi:hypothetical protein